MSTISLTKNTTEEEIVKPVADAREYLARLASDPDTDPEFLLSATHSIWARIAVAKLHWEIVQCLQAFDDYADADRDKALRNLFAAVLLRGADDSWSGRKNDARRTAFDAVRQEIGDLRWKLVRS